MGELDDKTETLGGTMRWVLADAKGRITKPLEQPAIGWSWLFDVTKGKRIDVYAQEVAPGTTVSARFEADVIEGGALRISTTNGRTVHIYGPTGWDALGTPDDGAPNG